MLNLGIILFIIAAIFGAVILTAILKNKPTPSFIVLMHGFFAVAGILIVITYVATGHTSTLLITSLVFLVLAALGGLTLLTIDLSNKPIPKAIALMHPVFALAGVIMLIIYALK